MTPNETKEINMKCAELLRIIGSPGIGFSGETGLKFHSDSNWQDKIFKKIEEMGCSWTLAYYPYSKRVLASIAIESEDITMFGEPGQSKQEVCFILFSKFIDFVNSKNK